MYEKIIGIGTDLVDIRRIERLLAQYNHRFIDRIFTPSEQARASQYSTLKQQAASYAKRFAAKEAIVKALGTGFNAQISFQDIEIDNDHKGKPTAKIKGGTLEYLNGILPEGRQGRFEISLTDEYPLAQAFVVLIAENHIS
jgi:holo-[acyl-carrier protein] synthase